MKAVNVDDVLKILHKYGRYIFVTDEKKYSDMVDEIANLKALKQEPIIDKIRAEIAELSHYYPMGHDYQIAITRCIAVIDKYRAESEGEE